MRENAECVADQAKEIPFLLVFLQFLRLGFVHSAIYLSRVSLSSRARKLHAQRRARAKAH